VPVGMNPVMTERTPGQDVDRGSGGLALLAVCLGFFVIQLDVTVVNVALPVIQREIGGSVAGLQRIVDAYTLAFRRGHADRGVHRGPAGPSPDLPDRAGGLRGRIGRIRAGSAAARGALGVALLGALAASRQHAIALRAPMSVAAAGYVLAIGLAWSAASARPASEDGAPAGGVTTAPLVENGGEDRPAAIGAAGRVLDSPLMIATAVPVPGGRQHDGVRPARFTLRRPATGQAGAQRL
jgi:hypothetical protein